MATTKPSSRKAKSSPGASVAMRDMISAIDTWGSTVSASVHRESLAATATAAIGATGSRVGPLLAAAMLGLRPAQERRN